MGQKGTSTLREGACDGRAACSETQGRCWAGLLGAWWVGLCGWSVEAVSWATEAPCEQAQRPIESPPPQPLASAPWPSAGEEAGPLPRNAPAPGGGGRGSTKPFSPRPWEGLGPSSLTRPLPPPRPGVGQGEHPLSSTLNCLPMASG